MLLVATLALAACGRSDTSYPVLGGGNLAFATLKGRVVFINYWAEWCAPCREEIPTFNAFSAAHQDHVQVLSVNFDGVPADALATQAQGLGIAFPTLLRDPRAELGVPPPMGLPETLVLDRGGNLARVLKGPQTRADLETVLAALPP
ncbi:MAG: TlpA family protein disulfide reductase [Porticoccaceae bacterium]